jgi:hypothetical protein
LGRTALEPANEVWKVKFGLPNACEKMKMIGHESEGSDAHAIKSLIAQ